MSTNLLHIAETHRLEGDYLNALDCFQEAINELEKRGQAHADIGVWAWAHKGEAYSALTQTLNELTPRQEEYSNQALYCFNRAIGLKDDNPEQPAIILPEVLLQNCTYTWAIAHRGEALRNHANLWRSLDKPERYAQAVKCFEQAIARNPQDAWAHAHLGATLCNARGWGAPGHNDAGKSQNDETRFNERQKNYERAMAHLDCALEIKKHNYPWCLAHKGVIYLQIGREIEAFYALLAAVYQDRNIFNYVTVIPPPWEFGQKRSRRMRYVIATVHYLRIKNKLPKTIEQEAYEQYFDLVRLSNAFWNSDSKPGLSKAEAWAIQKVRECVEKIKPGQPDEDKYYMLGGLLALEADLEPPQWIENIEYPLVELKRVLAQTPAKGEENEVQSLMRELETFENNFLSDQLKEVRWNEQKVNTALDLLAQALRCAQEKGGELLGDALKAQARIDRAWYHLRHDQRFQALTAISGQQDEYF